MNANSVDGARGTIALGATIINYSSDAAVLRGSYARVVHETARAAPARA